MGRIQSNIGLITGVPIEETVNQLMQLNSLPRNRLFERNTELGREQAALTSLTTLVIGVQLTTDRLGQQSLFNARSVASNRPDTISVRSTGSPEVGSFSFIPIRLAQSQQLTSSLFASSDQQLNDGQLKIYTGGFLDQSTSLDQLNGGKGVARGLLRITDRSGVSRQVDLRFAQNASDVVRAINSEDGLGVVARVEQGRFVLSDITGSTAGALTVQEVGTGTTARDLGLADVVSIDNVLSGSTVWGLSQTSALRNLLDGRGLELPAEGIALRFALQDGTEVDFSSSLNPRSASLGQLMDELNSAGDGKFAVRISESGLSLKFEDLTSGSEEFAISSPSGTLAQQLGLTGQAQGGVITGARLLSGLDDTLLSSLRGGSGLGALGAITITDRQGNTDTIDLSAAETLQEVIQTLGSGAQNSSFRVQLNRSMTGIELVDTSGGTGQLVIEDADASQTATLLGIAATTESSSVDSGSLGRQSIGRQTSIGDFLFGGTLSQSSFRVTDSQGISATFNVAARKPETMGDVIDGINQLGLGVTARINDSGDGILLEDTAGGSGTLSVQDVGSGTAAAQLRISGSAKEISSGSETISGIDGSRNIIIETNSEMTLADLTTAINEQSFGPVSANLINLGSSGVRLQLNSRTTGLQSRLTIDSVGGIDFSQTAEARDALLAFGASEQSGGVLVSSASNTFSDLIDGLELNVEATSDSPVVVTVSENSNTLSKQIETFVTQFNTLRDNYDQLTAFNPQSNEIGLLFGSNAALRLEIGFTRLFSSAIRSGSSGAIRSLPEVGISLNESGKLTFNKEQFERLLAENPEAVKDFFANETNGFSKKAKEVADSLAGVESGALLARNNALQQTIEQNASRIAAMDLRLERQRERLLQQFIGMEQAIARLQNNLSALNQLQAIPARRSS
jgi:flagellar hook-associated protein 2